MDAEGINDLESLEHWLKQHPDVVAAALLDAVLPRITHRVLPFWTGEMGQPWARMANVTALPLLRANFTSALVNARPTSDLRAAESAAREKASLAASIARRARAHGAAGAADTAAALARRRSGSSRIGHMAFAEDFTSFRSELWVELRRDIDWFIGHIDPVSAPLWSGTPPDRFTENDIRAREIWAREPETWSFWTRWWDGVLSGNQLDWELQKQVALIPDAIWQQGPKAVAEAIRGIEARRNIDVLIRENPYAWRISFNSGSQTFEASAVEPRDLSQVVADTRDQIKDFHNRCRKFGIGNFGQSVELAFAPVITLLRRDMKRYDTSPLSLFKALEAARREMQEIADKEGFAGESYLTRFFLGLQDCAEDICVAAPEIVEQLKAKEAVRYELYAMERRRATMLHVFGLHLDAEGILKRVALEALQTISNDSATDAAKKEAWYFATAVLPRAARAYLVETLDREDVGKPVGQSGRTKRLVDAADALSKLDKGKDALQENIPQLVDWVQNLIDLFSAAPPSAL